MTQRLIDPATLAALTENGAWPVFLFDVFLDAAPLRLGAGFIGPVIDTSESGGNVFFGLGEFGSFSLGAETVGGLASGARYSISGIDPATSQAIPGFRSALGPGLQTRVQGRRARLRLACLDLAGQIVGAPILLREDTGDSLSLIDTGDKLELSFTAELKSLDFKRNRRSTNSSVDHKRLHPGSPPDTFFDDDRWRRSDIRWGQDKVADTPTP